MEPEWLPYEIAANFRRMVDEGLLDEREQAFFTDSKLKKFWIKVSKYLSGIRRADYRSNAADQLVASFIAPLASYGKTGKADNPTFKTNIRTKQKEAGLAIKKIGRLAGELATALDDLEGITRFVPDETSLLVIVERLINEGGIRKFPSYRWRVRTSDALRILESSFGEYPLTDELFKNVPGMASQKSSWVDWMREAENCLREVLDVWPGELQLQEIDWVNLAKVLIGNHISSRAVQAARRSCNAQQE